MESPEIYLAITALAALMCVWAFCRQGRDQRRLKATPNSKVKGIFIGPVEVVGTIESGQPILSYLAEVPCVYFTATVSERWTRIVTSTETDSEGRTRIVTRQETGWSVVQSAGYSIPFDLRDTTGSIQVQPTGAVIEGNSIFSATVGPGDPLYYGKGPSGAVAGSDHLRRFDEVALLPGWQVFSVGTARERQDRVEPEIAKGPAGDRFLITTRTEAQVVSGHTWARVLLLLAVGFFFPILPLLVDHYSDLKIPMEQIVIATVAVWLALLLGESVSMLNVLKEIVLRTRHANTLIDVQLRRRADLIPQLSQAAKSSAVHENQVQALLAELRSSSRSVTMLAERYPQLQSDANFCHLMKELGETEERIALARSYYSQSYQQSCAACSQFPGMLFSSLTGVSNLEKPGSR